MNLRHLLLALMLTGCEGPSSSARAPADRIDDAALGDETRSADWLAFGRTYSEQRFSPLTQIDTATVAGLKVDWYLDLPDTRGLVSTPLVADGVLYFIGSMNVVRAVDAATGKVLWSYDPRVADRAARRMQAGWEHSRGVALWKDKVILATWDGRLIAVRAADGREVWSTQTIDTSKAMYITGAPKVFKNKVLIGNGGTEHGPTRGYVTAYDAETGRQAWRFYIVPGNPADGFENATMEMAAKTWTGEWWKVGGGGNAWHGFTYDAELDLLYIGTGNGSPWNRKIRSPGGGDNLFLSSIVALDPESGTYRWHYQTTPGESWDFNSNMDIVLADLPLDGRTVKALLHAPKNGFFYVIDRETGRLISADPFAEVTWASKVDLATGRPVEVPGARYENGYTEITPGPSGAHSWHAMSYNPGTGLAYFPVIHLKWFFADSAIALKQWRSPDWRVDAGVAIGVTGVRADGVAGTLQAWDPVNRRIAWEVPLEGAWQPGTMTTAGNLVFQGRADGHLVAYDARTGRELWKFNVGLGISAPPITYAVNGRQYVAVLVGWGGGRTAGGGAIEAARGWAYGVHPRRLVTFSLEGTARLPASPAPFVPAPLPAPAFRVDQTLAARGMLEFQSTCRWCHGPAAVSGGMAPDLRASGVVLSPIGFANLVRGGERKARGMPQYAHLSDEQLEALRHYIRRQAEAGLKATPPAP